jgi:hypothetical protein
VLSMARSIYEVIIIDVKLIDGVLLERDESPPHCSDQRVDRYLLRYDIRKLIPISLSTSLRTLNEIIHSKRYRSNVIQVINLSEFDPEIFYSQPLVAFVIASYGSGGPTADAESFHEWLQS